MKKSRKKSHILLFVGVLILFLVQILQHFNRMPEALYGASIGIAMGVSFIGIILAKKKNSIPHETK